MNKLKLVLPLAFLFVFTTGVYAQSPDAQTAAQKYFTDTELVTQDGKPVRFYSDVLKDKIVVINCFFATCQGSCLPMSRTMVKLQQLLEEKGLQRKNVSFISISVDPEHDTPERLKKYATSIGGRPSWLLLTGTKVNVDFIHSKLGQYVEDKANHNNIFLIGNLKTGLWKKAFGLSKPDDLYQVLESVMNDTGAAKQGE